MAEEESIASAVAAGEGDAKLQAQMSGMKFSLSKSKRPPTVHGHIQNPKQSGAKGSETEFSGAEGSVMEFFTVVDDRGIVVSNGSKSKNEPKVIPKLEDTWRPEKRMKNIMIEEELEAQDRFVGETLAMGPQDGVQYGLSLRKEKVNSYLETNARQDRNGSSEVPEVGEGRPSYAEIERRKFKENLEQCADEAPIEAYEQIPVEEFGLALLRGFGWEKGKPIGRNSKAVVEPVQYVRKAGMEGLGATPLLQLENEKKFVKPAESRQKMTDFGAVTAHDGQSLKAVSSNEKLGAVAKKGIHVGKVISIIGGRHAGSRAEVIEASTGERRTADEVFVKLVKSGETVVVKVKDTADVDLVEEEKAMKQLKEMDSEVKEKHNRNDKISSRYDEGKEQNLVNKKEDIERIDRKRDSRIMDDGYGRISERVEKDGSRQTDSFRDRSERDDRNTKHTHRKKEHQLELDEKSSTKSKERIENLKDNSRKHREHKSKHSNRDDIKVNNNTDDRPRREKEYESRHHEKEASESIRRMDIYDRKDKARYSKHSEAHIIDRKEKAHYSKHSEAHIIEEYKRTETDARRNREFDLGYSDRENSRGSEMKESNFTRDKVDRSDNVAERGGPAKESSTYLASEKPTKPWLRSHIRVRIVSKRFLGGKYYLKKGRVVDVISPTVCDILLDETNKLLQEVKQEYLETALPKKGGRVVLLGGEHQGLLGKFIERNSDSEVALIQMEETFQMVTISLDLVAEFIGDPDDIH